jgi:CheY-like chemotaxis protein
VGNVSSGEEAISASDRLRPELVLMDARLGGEMDGIQAAEIIHDRFNVPVVYLTAYADEETLMGFAKVTRDLTERRLADEKREAERSEAAQVLRESEEKFRLLVDQVRDYAIFSLDPEDTS